MKLRRCLWVWVWCFVGQSLLPPSLFRSWMHPRIWDLDAPSTLGQASPRGPRVLVPHHRSGRLPVGPPSPSAAGQSLLTPSFSPGPETQGKALPLGGHPAGYRGRARLLPGRGASERKARPSSSERRATSRFQLSVVGAFGSAAGDTLGQPGRPPEERPLGRKEE